MPTHVVIGGGITGLAACWYLAKAGHRPVLIEKQDRLGGVIRTDVVEGCLIEGGPDSFLATKPATLELIRELGIEDDVIASNDHRRVTYIVRHGRLVPMPEGFSMMVPTRIRPVLSSALLSWGTKIRMGLEFFRRPRQDSAPERSVAELVREHYGQEAVDYLAEPLLSGVYGGDPEQLSAEATLPQFVEMERQYGSLTKGTLALRAKRTAAGGGGALFRTLKGGMEQLTGTLTEQLAGRCDRVHGEVLSIHDRDGGGYRVELEGASLHTEKVYVCSPAPSASRILASLDPSLSGELGAIRYNSSMTVALGYRETDVDRPPKGFGFLVPKVERRRLVACTFVKTKFGYRVPDDKLVLRCFLGGDSMADGDTEIVRDILPEVAKYTGITAAPLFQRVQRWHGAMAQYTIGHRQRVASVRRLTGNHPGLYLAGNAYEGIGIPDCIRTARAAVEASIGLY